MNSKILATGSYLPKQIRTNADLEKMVDTSDEWIVTRSGMKERRIATPDETVATMGFEAAKQCLVQANLDPQEIDLIVVGTTSNSHAYPSAACQIQGLLGIEDAISFDVAAACTGFVYALSVADQFVRTGKVKKALVVGADLNSRKLDETDRSTVVLFGDGAGAVILEASEEQGIISTHLHASADTKESLVLPNADRTEPKSGFISATAEKLEMSLDQVVVTVDRYGNTSAATIPVALDEAVRDGRIQRGQLLLLEAFGGGWTWGSALVRF